MIAVSSQSLAPAIGTAALVLAWIWPFAGGPSPATLPWLVSAACLSVWVLVALWQRVDVAHCAARAWLISALLSSAIGLLQFFGVSGSFKPWVNVTGLGDAFGNLRQRNQFATLTMVGLAVVMLGPLAGRRPATPPVSGASRRGHAGVHFAVAAGSTVWPGLLAAALLAAGNAASSSRTGLLQLGLIVLLMLCWKKHTCPVIRLRLATAVVTYALASMMLPLLAGLDPWSNGLAGRFGDADRACGSRRLLWANVSYLIGQRPWSGWGWGELDYAHFITAYPGARFCDILDNAHNLPLHVAVELGVPVAIGFCAWVGWLVARARPWRETNDTRRVAWAVLALIGLHSMLEYPLWYGPFQIAVVLASWILWRTRARRRRCARSTGASGLDAALPPAVSSAVASVVGAAATAVLIVVAYAAWDYHRVSQIYRAPALRASAYRDDTMAKVRESRLFRNQVLFADLTLTGVTVDNAESINRSAHALLRFSPEARVVEKLIDSALLLGKHDEAVFFMRRMRIAYPEEYAIWRATREHVVQLPAIEP